MSFWKRRPRLTAKNSPISSTPVEKAPLLPESLPKSWDEAQGRIKKLSSLDNPNRATLHETSQLNVFSYRKSVRFGGFSGGDSSGPLAAVFLLCFFSGILSVATFSSRDGSNFLIFFLLSVLSAGILIPLVLATTKRNRFSRKWVKAEERDIRWLSKRLKLSTDSVYNLLSGYTVSDTENGGYERYCLYITEEGVTALYSERNTKKLGSSPEIIKIDNKFVKIPV